MPSTTTPITASMLYNYVTCPHRVAKDLYANPRDKDTENPFVELLWERGTLYEDEVINNLKLPFLDLRSYAGEEKAKVTLQAMKDGVSLIYSARIQADDLLGDPDLLRKEGDGYVPIDIKSGSGEEGSDEEEGKPKKTYAVQLSLYVDILERLHLSAERKAYIWNIHGQEILYKVDEPRTKTGTESLWQEYQDCLKEVRGIVARTEVTLPACASACNLCHWHSACLQDAKSNDDLTLICGLGRDKRDKMMHEIPTVRALAECNPEAYFVGKKKTRFAGVGPDSLVKFQRRARLLSGLALGPYLKEPIMLPSPSLEIYFDVEVDTMRDRCYLHGFVERLNRDSNAEKYIPFFMETVSDEAEKEAFKNAWQYLQERQPCVIYYYSKYERTTFRKLQAKYPDVCAREEVELLFDPLKAIDLLDIVRKKTEWPTYNQSIKTLAKSVGFKWRDTHPSGAASIQWFDEWVKSGDLKMKQRILDYNEDDCVATRWLLDAIRNLVATDDQTSEFAEIG